MGLGTKIKEALTGDKDHNYGPSNMSKTPGSFPVDEVPRSYNQSDPNGNRASNFLQSASSPTTGKLPGRNSADYTYSSSNAAARTAGTAGRHSYEGPGTQKNIGIARSGGLGWNQSSSTAGNNSSQGQNDPYWADVNEPNVGSGGVGGGAGTYSRTGNDSKAQEITDRYHNSGGTQRDDFAHTGPRSRVTGKSNKPSGVPTGEDYECYDDGQGSTQTTSTTTTTGTTTNLARRPIQDSGAAGRGYKTEQYNSPTSTTGRGQGLGSTGAGIAGGAAAGYGVSELAGHSRGNESRNQYNNRGDNDSYDDLGSRGGSRITSSQQQGAAIPGTTLDPNSRNTATQSSTGVGTSMLDPYGTSSFSQLGSGSGANTGTSLGDDMPMRLQDERRTSLGRDQGMSSAMGSETGTAGMTGQDYDRGAAGTSQKHGKHQTHQHHQDTKVRRQDSGRSSEYSNEDGRTGRDSSGPGYQAGSGAEEQHFGPGHAGAKVMHRCVNCGVDNDISKHFRKDAVYRMG